MKKYLLSVLLLMVFLVSKNAFAQLTYSTNSFGRIEKTADVNFTELANYCRLHPSPSVRKPVFDEDGEEERAERPIADPAMVHVFDLGMGGRTAETPHTAYLPLSPAPLDTFQAKVSDGTSIPPDTHGDVDSTYCVTAINTSITIQNRTTHAVISSVSLDAWWTSTLTHGTSIGGAFDPRVHYDPHYKRWIMVCDAYGQTNFSQIMIAVSATSNPTGTWHIYTLNLNSSTGVWLDYPNVGYNNRWIVVSGNFFTSAGAFTNDAVYVFDYASMRAGGAMTYGTLLPPGGSFTVCPAITYDTAESNMFCTENYNGGAGQIELWKITGAIGAGLAISSVGFPSTTNHWQSNGPGGGADFAPQTGTTYKLQCNDDRIHSCKQRNGTIWCAHTAFLPATGAATRASSYWWQVDTLAAPLQVGIIDDPSVTAGHNFYFFPSLAVNKNNDVLIGFAQANSNIHPSCGYALHLNSDGASTWRPVYTYRHGLMTYYQTFGGGSDRWGDYSATSVDPRNDVDFWTIQESVPTYTGGITNSIWDTWWAYVQVCTPILAPTAGVAPSGPCSGTTQWYSVTPVTGASSYTWTITGTGWSGASTTDSINLTVGSGIATVSVVANNSCTTSTAYTFTVSPSPLPGLPVVTIPTVTPCAGAPSATYTGTSTNATSFHWTVTGTGWTGTSATGTFNPAVGTGVGQIIVYGTNTCGNGPSTTVNVTPSTGPPTPTIALSGPMPCTGATTANYTGTSAGATSFNWTVLGTGWSGSSTTTAITVTLGTGSGTLICKGVNACGTSAPDTLIITTSPLPSTPVVTPPATACTGSTVTITAVSSGAVNYNWAVTGSGWSGTSTTGTLVATVGSGVGRIIVYGINLCGNSTPDTINITPTAFPGLPSIALAGPSPCTGATSVNYTGTSTGATGYTWTVLGTGWSGGSTTSAITVTIGAGSGTVICHGTNVCGTSVADTLIVTPGALPALPVVTPPSTLPCTGTAIYTASSTGATSYNWTVTGTGWSGSSATNSLTVTIGTSTGQIIVYGINACGNGTSDTINVTPSAFPTTPVITLASPLPCTGATTATYTATSTGAVVYNWTVLGTGWSGSSTTGTIVVTLGTGSGTIICSATNGCGTSSSDTINLTPSPFPTTPTLSLIGTTPCLTATTAQYAANSIGAVTYTWTVLGTGWSGTSTTDTINLTVGTGTATIICSATNACGTSGFDTAYLTPSSGVSPASAIISTGSICAGSTATFVTSGIAGATSYVWSVTGTGWVGSSTTTMLTVTVGTGPATISVYGTSPCGSGLSYTLAGLLPIIPPTAAFSIASHVVPAGTADVITYTGTGGTTGTYSWNFAGGVATPGGGMGPNSVVWSSTGLKTITLSVTDSGCNSTIYLDTVLVVPPTEFNNIYLKNTSVNIVPNPNDGNFDIEFVIAISSSINVKLTDVQGRIVYENKFEGTTNNKLAIDAKKLPNAVYTATIVTNGAVVNKKVVIRR